MMDTVLKFLQCRWLISENMPHFQLAKTQISRNLNKTVNVKIGGTFEYFESS